MPLTVRDPAYFFPILSATLLSPPSSAYVFEQFVSKEFDFSKTEGDTIQINRYGLGQTGGYDQISRQLSETQTVGINDPVNITATSVTVMLQEYAGPYNATAGHVAPLGVTEKVAKRAQEKLIDDDNPKSFTNSIGAQLLKGDLDKWHDKALCSLYLTSANSTNPGDKTNATATATDKISTADLATIKEKLQVRGAPTFNDGLHIAIISPRMEKHLKLDPDFRAACQFGAPERLYRGQLGVYEGFRFISSTIFPTETINGLTGHLGVFISPNAIGYGEGLAPEVRMNKNDDYERFLYLIWLTYRGYCALNTQHIEVARTFGP